MSEKSGVFTKEDANKALDNINMWINNCDSKVAILLGFYAVIITIALSTDFLKIQSEIVTKVITNPNVCKVTYGLFYVGSIIVFLIGVVFLFKVVIPRIIRDTEAQENYNSVIFFSSIVKNNSSYEAYREKIYNLTDEKQILDDLLFQVHSAALICEEKFKYQKWGLLLSSIAIIFFFIETIIGVFLL